MSSSPRLGSIRRRTLLRALAASGITVSVAGCSEQGDGGDGSGGDGSSGGSTETTSGGRRSQANYVLGTTSGASGGLNPLAVGDSETQSRLNLLYDGGGVIDDDTLSFQGRWLESWELSDDAKTVEYRVRDGLEWGGDYGSLTAETYLYNIEHVFTRQWSQYTQAGQYSVAGEPIEYKQTGELTFEATLPQTRANFLHEDPVIPALLLPIDLVKQYEPPAGETPAGDASPRNALDKDPDVTNATLVGNLGPFTLDSYDKGSRMVVSANEDYYLADTDVDDGAFHGSPKLATVTTQVFEERSTDYSALKAGDVTATGIEARKKAEFEGVPGVKLWTSKYGDYLGWLSINHRANGWAPLRESRQVRQAFAHLLDKQTLIQDIFDGNANPIDTFHPRWGPYYSDAKISRYDYDPARAKRLLESGTSSDFGYDDSGAFVGPDGTQVELTFVTRSDIQTGQLVASFMRKQFEDAGFSVTVKGLPFSKILGTYFANSVANNPNYDGKPDWGPVTDFNGGPWNQAVSTEPWDLVYGVGSNTGAYAPWQTVRAFITERGAFNAFGYHTDAFDFQSAIDSAASAATKAEATAALEDMFGFLSEDLPLLWTRNNHRILGFRESVSGLPPVKNFFSQPDVRLVSME